MRLRQRCHEGEYRICVGALDAPRGQGYIAALVVRRVGGLPAGREAYRDDSLACGYRWKPPAEEAIATLLGTGRGN
ncbi:MAG: hypothetical protein IPN37_07190 [Betaproteobacteria bacterium]|nr:hypothetical protein [Betaproteobacteria bacterium]